jgi:hypothetical protein
VRRSAAQRRSGVNSWVSDAALQDPDIVHASGLQIVAESNTGYQGSARTVMKPAQIVEKQRLQPAQTIVLGVAVEVGVKATQYRNPQTLCRAYCYPAERPLRRHIHDIGTVLRPTALEQSTPWHANMHPLIPRDRQARDHCHLEIAIVTGTIRGLPAWTHHGHCMTLPTQPFHQVGQGHSDAVDVSDHGVNSLKINRLIS